MSLIVLLAIYFLPSLVAAANERRKSKAIFLTNMLLGWTVIGWIVAMVWALNHEAPASPVTTVAVGTETAGTASAAALTMARQPAMTFRPSSPEECEGFQMLGSGICCATCEWAGDQCPFARNRTAHPSEYARPIAADCKLSGSVA